MREGDPDAENQLYQLVYDDLHAIATKLMAQQRRDHTLQATALVREAYLRLSHREAGWESYGHFLCVAARAMRHVLVDHARRHRSLKRGGNQARVELETVVLGVGDQGRIIDVLDLHTALERLSEQDATAARLVELRFFGGMSTAEMAEVLKISSRTCERLWTTTRAWLKRELT